MGTVEQGARVKRKKRNLQRAVLATLGVTGGLAFALVAPQALKLLEVTGVNAKLRYRTMSVLTRLKQKGLVVFVEEGGKTFARLSEAGERELERLKIASALVTRKPKRWDRRYRLVMFDIPERRKSVRDRLRAQMDELGFLRVQDSAWLYPYDCEEYVALLKADLHIGKDVLYAVVEEIENDRWIRKHFNLPND